MATLTGSSIASTYTTLLKLTSAALGADASGKYIEDAAGTDSVLSLSTTRVGIGTAAPAYTCHIADTDSTGQPQLAITGVGGEKCVLLGDESNNSNVEQGRLDLYKDDALKVYLTSSATAASYLNGGGNFGIGTAAPENQLSISSATGGTFELTRGTKAAELSIADTHVLGTISFVGYDSGSYDGRQPGAYIKGIASGTWSDDDVNDAPTDLQFFTQSDSGTTGLAAPRMIINDEGNVGIGADPGTTLEINAGSGNNTILTINTTSADDDSRIVFECAGAHKWQVENDFGGTGSSSFKITDHDGAQGVELIQNDGDGFAVVSDERWKTDWTEYSGALDGIKTLRAGKYKFKNLTNGNIPDVWNSGLIAQDVEKILPNCVHTGSYGGVDAVEAKDAVYETVIIQEAVDAVEGAEAKDAVLDDDGNIVEEAVESVEAVEAVEEVTEERLVYEAVEAVEAVEGIERKSLSYQAMIPYLVKAIQELSAKVTALENK